MSKNSIAWPRLRTSLSDRGAGRDICVVGAFQIDKSKFEIRLEWRRLDLTRIGFRLLTLLIERRGRTQSREALHSDVLGYQNPIITRTVDTRIRRLRGKLGSHAQRLETVRAEGYRFNPVLDPLPPMRTRRKRVSNAVVADRPYRSAQLFVPCNGLAKFVSLLFPQCPGRRFSPYWRSKLPRRFERKGEWRWCAHLPNRTYFGRLQANSGA